MDLALHFPVIKQGFRRGRSANLFMYELTEFRQIADAHSPRAFSGDRRAWPQEKAPRSKKGFVCCKKESDQSKMKQEEIISLFRRIQASISKGDSVGGIEEDKNRDGTTENVPLSKVILDILEKPRKNTEVKEPPERQVRKVTRPPSSFAKRSPFRPSDSSPRGKLPVTKSDIATEEMTKKEEKAPLIETMKLAELKEVAKNKGIKGYSKLKKSDLLDLIRSY